IGRKSHHHPVGMMCCLLINGVDQVEAVPGQVTLSGLGIYPDREELGAEVPTSCLFKADVPDVIRIGGPNIVSLIQKALRRVGVRVNDQGRVMNLPCLGADSWVRSLSNRDRRHYDYDQERFESHSLC